MMFGQRVAPFYPSFSRHTYFVATCARGMHAATMRRSTAILGLSGIPNAATRQAHAGAVKKEVFVTSRPLWASGTRPAQPTPSSSIHTLGRKMQTGALQMWATHTALLAGPLSSHQRTAIRNLSMATRKGRSVYRGVCWKAKDSQWAAQVAGVYLGVFADEEAAAHHYDVAVKYLVGQGVLGNQYLARTNVALGHLQPFKATRAELEEVKARWTERLEWKKTSLYRGVSLHVTTKPWLARVTVPGSGQKHVRCFTTEGEAAVSVRSMDMTKTERLRRINFYRETDYLTEEEVQAGEYIGVRRHRRKRPYHVQINSSRALRDMILLKENMSVHEISVKRVNVGSFLTAIEAAQAYDTYVLGQWAKALEPRGPLPPTNFSPTRYGYDLIDPPIAESTARSIETDIDTSRTRGRPPTPK
eukprot:comp15045_c0_seq1/m.11671 comp15045_c0_seq1/g.11671  ORF comp15045_c0_seq1/g.11671 comp15045_c0_seq1/m.11671 type:complete len:416 (-) comp15045_c0_seq1:552-1799(-)